ncbi:glycosyltransferase, partial [Rhizobiaceae sp. 2RAB30]
RLHQELLSDQENCLVVATASRLLDDVKAARTDNFGLVTNGVDVGHFAVRRERNATRADFSAIIERGRPIVGYFGALASWIDYELLHTMAAELPGVEIVLIGPDYDGSKELLRSGPGNVHLLDAIEYEALPKHAVWFDVAIIPFIRNDITDATSPLKLFEYMALGLPIVSTDITEARKYRSVRVGASRRDFISLVAEIVEQGTSEFERTRIRQEAEANSWSAKAEALLQLLDRH